MNSNPIQTNIPIDGMQRIDDDFKTSFKKSLIIHSAILLLTLLGSVVFPHKGKILQSSLRVDLVSLPDIKKADLSKAEIAESEKETIVKAPQKTVEKEKAEPDTMTLKKEKAPTKKNLKSAIDRIKSLEALEESLKKDKANANKVVAKGNKLARGSSLIGDPSDSFNEYADKMKARLASNWDLPVWLTKQDLSAQVYLTLDKYGNVTNTVITKSSGNKQFDGYVLRTVQLSQPFGPAPEEIIDSGVTLGFPL